MQIVYEDNHVIIVNKEPGEIVQGDKTGDEPLSERVKSYIKEAYAKPGAVFLGVVHRLDRPVGGLVVFARTSKALTRLNTMFREGSVHKTYWALVEKIFDGPTEWSDLRHWVVRKEQQNKSYAYDREVAGGKQAELSWRVLSSGERYSLVEVKLKTGRHHQIRCQLSKIGMPIKGDLKYGAHRSNADGSISLLARFIDFVHPVSGKQVHAEAPLPHERIWEELRKKV